MRKLHPVAVYVLGGYFLQSFTFEHIFSVSSNHVLDARFVRQAQEQEYHNVAGQHLK